VPSRDTENRARPTASVPIFSASGTGSPVVLIAFTSNGCATSVRSRTKSRYPCGAYVRSVCAEAKGFDSFDPSRPMRYMLSSVFGARAM
jgi:hypothetical protein